MQTVSKTVFKILILQELCQFYKFFGKAKINVISEYVNNYDAYICLLSRGNFSDVKISTLKESVAFSLEHFSIITLLHYYNQTVTIDDIKMSQFNRIQDFSQNPQIYML